MRRRGEEPQAISAAGAAARGAAARADNGWRRWRRRIAAGGGGGDGGLPAAGERGRLGRHLGGGGGERGALRRRELGLARLAQRHDPLQVSAAEHDKERRRHQRHRVGGEPLVAQPQLARPKGDSDHQVGQRAGGQHPRGAVIKQRQSQPPQRDELFDQQRRRGLGGARDVLRRALGREGGDIGGVVEGQEEQQARAAERLWVWREQRLRPQRLDGAAVAPQRGRRDQGEGGEASEVLGDRVAEIEAVQDLVDGGLQEKHPQHGAPGRAGPGIVISG
ncbi:MAG: hypothetical protein J3K34DRAFT_422977 [Monoraphidium minutum]|nr:MAG: hypothetical protein J3K34DRAFT_422977 [Monoraphidium minutum]